MRLYRVLVWAGVMLAAVTVTLAVLAGSGTLTVMGQLLSDKSVKLAVLMYHSVDSSASRSGEFVITPAALRRDLTYLQQEGYNTITMSELIAFVHEGTPLPEKPVMLTFDDGYYNNYCNVFPLLQEFNAKAVISIIGIETDKFTQLGDNNEHYSHLTWEQICEMQQSGLVEFQNHGYNMHKSPGQSKRVGSMRNPGESVEDYQQALAADIAQLQQQYTEMTGWTPNTYAYPFGRISKDSYPVITRLGFAASLDVQARPLLATPGNERCLFRIPRYNRTSNTSAAAILKKAMAQDT